jgi:hypothetical protein
VQVEISGTLEYRFVDVPVDVPDGTPISSMARYIEETVDFERLREGNEPELDIDDIQNPDEDEDEE